jgi:hypothetical protein
MLAASSSDAPMRLTAASIIVVFLLPILAEGQDAASPQTEKPSNEIRGEMLSEYRFTPSGSKPAAIPTALQSDVPPLPVSQDTNGDVVKMDPFEVRDSASSSAAYLPLERAASVKAPSTVASKLGIGEHDFKVGKVHAFVITILYVPIVAGFSW